MYPAWTPPTEWAGQDAFLIGGGPSLKGFDFNLLKGKNTIGSNDAVRLGAEIVRYGIFGDMGWWHRNKWYLEDYPGKVVSVSPSLLRMNLPYLLKMIREKEGIHVGTRLGWNYSTGATAMNLAISLGAQRIFLLGYDLMSRAGQTHWHNYNKGGVPEESYARFLRGFYIVKQSMPQDIEVFNVTNGSRLTAFPCMSFEDFYEILKVGVPA